MLETEDLHLTALRPDDSETLFEWINHRDLVLLSSGYQPIHWPNHEHWFNDIVRRDDTKIFAIRSRLEKGLIGYGQLHSHDRHARSAELQIRLGDMKYVGRGLGTQAVRALLHFGFRDLNLHRIYLSVFEKNVRAIKCYRKNGFRDEGVLREARFIDGAFENVLVMGILETEFRQL